MIYWKHIADLLNNILHMHKTLQEKNICLLVHYVAANLLPNSQMSEKAIREDI